MSKDNGLHANKRANEREIFEDIRHNRIGSIKRILNQSCPSVVHYKDESGWTPLHSACLYNYGEIAQLFIDAGADVNAQKENGWTPLHVACSHGHADVAKLLINAGVDWLAITSDRRTPVDVAIYGRHKNLLMFMDSMIDQLPASERKKIQAWRFRQELTKTS